MSNKHWIQIASVPDRENLVAELWYDDSQWGELSNLGDKIQMELYPKQNGEAWNFELDEVLTQLSKAKCELLGSKK